ncbi:mechanosensitive ion channel protein MscS [Polaribacter sp. ALD11]|uniref:mechanosensitive ion channel family protein n=1 Tax=Polaribacter sp. ALD11 TaxID=2058137 RepID=UPI000C300681|nr:mechanosensitive ion channel family protein [Polaribacter sp. ALD11]AUC86144.1 mechanosensitive ion channel protein MscS [Polaribacter sp. ALD11]
MRKLFWLLFLVSFITNAQKDSIHVDLSSPHATLYTHLYFLQSDSYQPKKAAKTILGLPEKEAVKKVIRIKKILDGKGLFVDFEIVPKDPNFKDTIRYSSYQKYTPFPQKMPQISVEKVGDNWYYSSETVAKIDVLYSAVFPWYVQKIQNIIPEFGHKKILGIEYWQLFTAFIFILISVLLFYFFKRITFYLLNIIQQRITKTTDITFKKSLKKIARPISLLLVIGFIDKVFPSLQFSLETNTWVFLFMDIAAVVFWTYVFLNIVHILMKFYSVFTEKTHNRLDDQLSPILHNFFTGLVIIGGVLKLISLFGVDTTTILAGATIGGLAVALASQDTVKNLIGTIMIFLDKPFHIEDWIEAGDFAGTVEKVGFRSTTVRAADTSVYQIPNSRLSEIVINNKGLRLFRRYNTNLGLRYDTPPELIEAFVKGVREIIIEHPETRSDSYNVEFTGFGDSALLVMVNVYFKSLAWGVEQSSKHRLHIAIVKLAKELGVDFAFPSTTVTIENFPEKKGMNPKYDINKERISASITKVLEEFKNEHPNSEMKRNDT